jgi:hypothetical protein
MAKKLFLVIGNGFSIDFIRYIGRHDDIDVINLFNYGADVPWPVTGTPGFLSRKHCPNLWSLGARPAMDGAEGLALIEDIITCANIDASKRHSGGVSNQSNIYGMAYKELVQYLRHLFVYYNCAIPDIPDSIEDWKWARYLMNCVNSDEYSEITIVSYNYDCWLERVFQKIGIPFKIGLIDANNHGIKITLIKPHGSITFIHKTSLDMESYSVGYERDLWDGSIGDFTAEYNNLARNHLVTALIPPAGESGRFQHAWSTQLRTEAKSRAAQMSVSDEIMVCGMSYWHVDRAELDELFNSFNSQIEIALVNPRPSRTLTAVLTSSFPKFVLYPSARILRP